MQPDVSLGVALYDYAPNIVFVFGIYWIIKSLKSELSKSSTYLIVFASALVIIAGILKATWKLIIALSGSDVRILSDIMFPLMGTGFFLIFIVLLMVVIRKNPEKSFKPLAIASSKKIFLPLMIIGGMGTTICLLIISWRKKARAAFVLFIIELIMTLMLGYVGGKFEVVTNFGVFLEQTLNLSSRIVWMLGCFYLYKKSSELNPLIK
ncbi:MAG: hypothetical protein HZA77_10565 [Candidatus Schekmanbacteria bacterium]|nr:hypothetical protein [Candidatus Schekmanbacteria bacterium]